MRIVANKIWEVLPSEVDYARFGQRGGFLPDSKHGKCWAWRNLSTQ